MMIFSDKKGFTLVELLMVIAIVGILAAVAIPIFDSFSDDSKIDEMKSVMLVAAASQEKFYLSEGRYGNSGTDKDTLVSKFAFPKDTTQMKLTTGVIIKDGVGMGYWVSGVRKIRGNLHCWLYTSSFMDTTEATNFKEFKSGDSNLYKGASCSW